MNKKALIALVLIVLALLAGYFLFFRKSSTGNPLTSIQSGNTSGPKSLKDLITAGVAQKCTFSSTSDSGSNDGTVYVTSGKMRGDFTMVMTGKTMISHMIVDGTTSYMWTEGEKNGYKMTFDMSAQTETSGDTTKKTDPMSGVSPDEAMDYKCSAWIVDSSMFQPPSDVKFMEFNMPTTAPQSSSGSGSASQCSYCDSLTGDSKAQCIAAFGCK